MLILRKAFETGDSNFHVLVGRFLNDEVHKPHSMPQDEPLQTGEKTVKLHGVEAFSQQIGGGGIV